MNKTDLVKNFSLMLFVSFFLHNTSIAEVDSISPERLEQYGKDLFWQSDVKCKGVAKTVAIQQKNAGSDWCIRSIPADCQDTKMVLAKRVCSPELLTVIFNGLLPQSENRNRNNIGATNRTDQANRSEEKVVKPVKESALLNEQILLKEERIKIDQEKLELRQLEFQLKKRAYDIEQKLKTLD